MSGESTEIQDDATHKERLWTPMFVLIIAATLCCYMVGQGTNAGTSVYLDLKGGSATLAGIGAAIFSVAAAVSRIVCGPILDNKGRLGIMLTGAVLLFIGTIGPTFVTDLRFFVLWRFLQGAGFASATTATATAAADVLPLSRLGEGIGYHGLGQALSMSIGPALALFLVATDPAENLYLGLSAAAVLAFAFSLFCRYEKDPSKLPATSEYRRLWEEKRAQRQPRAKAGAEMPQANDEGCAANASASLGNKLRNLLSTVFETRALPGTIPMMVLCPTFGFGIFFVGLLGTSLGVENAGLFYTLSAVSMIVVRLKSGSFMDSVPAIKITTVAVTCGIICYVLLLACSLRMLELGLLTALFYGAGIFYGLCLGLAMPVNQTVAVKNSPAERWGAASALYLFAIDCGIGVACIIWGVINDTLGFTVTICCVLGIIALSYVAAWVCYPAADKRWK